MIADGTVTESEIQCGLYDELRRYGYQVTFHTLGHTMHLEALNPPCPLRIAVDAMLADG